MSTLMYESRVPDSPLSLTDYRICWQMAKDVYTKHKIVNHNTKIQVDYELLDYGEEKLLLLAFAGSWDFLDWIRNLVFYRQDNPFDNDESGNVTVHTGWMLGYKSIREELLRELELLNFNRIKLVGHSAGGATACIAAIDLMTTFGVSILPQIVTFGAASPGNKKFADLCDMYVPHHYRYVAQFDPVALMPPGCPLLELGYHQPGKHITVNGFRSHGLEDYKF